MFRALRYRSYSVRMKYFYERYPARRRSIMVAPHGSYSYDTKIEQINVPEMVFVTSCEFIRARSLFGKTYEALVQCNLSAFMVEDNKAHYILAPNTNIGSPGGVCLGTAREVLIERAMKNERVGAADLYWNSTFYETTPFTWGKLGEVSLHDFFSDGLPFSKVNDFLATGLKENELDEFIPLDKEIGRIRWKHRDRGLDVT